MSFSKTVSVCAALASIFAAGAAGWKLANENQTQPEPQQDVSIFEKKITELEQELNQVKEQPKTEPVVVQQQTPQPTVLPPLPPVPEPKPGEIE
jgi:hypothetical protein